MADHWDEFTMSLADQTIPRRQSLRLLGAALAGALLSPLGAATSWAGAGDPCRNFCSCANRAQQRACLAACRACSDTSRLCGSCAGGYACTDMASDFRNCGACGHACAEPGPYQEGACIFGECAYTCIEGATDCGGDGCTSLSSDPSNCGACGNVCSEAAPYCLNGVCVEAPCPHPLTLCGDTCVNLFTDWFNCGACGLACVGYEYCANGSCENYYPPIPD